MSLQFSLTGDRFLVATGNSQAKIFNRDGYQIAECVKGDMYLSDMNNTAGHISSLGNAMWSPTLKVISRQKNFSTNSDFDLSTLYFLPYSTKIIFPPKLTCCYHRTTLLLHH